MLMPIILATFGIFYNYTYKLVDHCNSIYTNKMKNTLVNTW